MKGRRQSSLQGNKKVCILSVHTYILFLGTKLFFLFLLLIQENVDTYIGKVSWLCIENNGPTLVCM